MAIERALAKILKTEEVPDDAVCYICLDREGGPDGGAVPLRGCACRGPSAGFAHVDCLAEMAARDEVIAVEGRGWTSLWGVCAICHQAFTGSLEVKLDRLRWRHFRDTSTEEKCHALTNVAYTLIRFGEFDVAERLYEEARRGVADDDQTYHRLVVPSEVSRASALNCAGRPHDALEVLTQIQRRTRMRVSGDVLNRVRYYETMSATLSSLGRLEEALRFAVDAVELGRTVYGPQSNPAVEAMYVHGQLLERIGRIEEAKATMGDVLAACTIVFGADHERTHKARNVLRRISARSG